MTVRPDYADVTGDVTLRVSGEQHARHTITWQHAEESYLDLEKSTLPAESIDGEQVTAELWVKPDYYLASAAISAQGVEPELIERVYVRFKMPAEDVTVTLNFEEKIPVAYTPSDHITEATFYDADDIYYGVPTDKGIPGEKVYLFASAEEGYKPMRARIASSTDRLTTRSSSRPTSRLKRTSSASRQLTTATASWLMSTTTAT